MRMADAVPTEEVAVAVKDSNGTVFSATNYSLSHLWERVGVREGDCAVKDLKVMGASIPLKRGNVIKNIRLVEDDEPKATRKIKGLALKACFLKKA